MKLKVALCQMEIIWEDKIKNYEKANKYIKEAALESADIIFFPEMSFTGFSMNIEKTKEINGETIEFIKRNSIENNISIGFGWVKGNSDKAENHYSIINSKGDMILDYIKIHPFSYADEDKYFISGNEISHCEINGLGISIFICYDLRFPEIFQSISNKVSLIVIPANWPQERNEHWITLLKARAIENQVYILGINSVGKNNGLCYSGDSCIFDPLGNKLKELSNEEGIIFEDISINIDKLRADFPVKFDRKVNLYKEIL